MRANTRNSEKKQISAFKSFLQFSYGTWVLALINLLATPVTTWLISPENFGKASMFTILYNFLINIVLVGADQSFCRMYYEQSTRRRPSLLNSSMALPLVLTVFFGGVIVLSWDLLSVALFGGKTSLMLALAVSLSLLSGVVFRFGTVLLRMQKSANIYSLLSILNGVFNVSFVIIYCLWISKDFRSIIYGFLLANMLTAALTIVVNFKFWRIAAKQLDKAIMQSVVRYGLPFVPVFIIDWLFQATDRFFLRKFTSFEDIGIYAASFKIVAALNMLQTGFNLFWVPYSYEKFASTPEDKGIYSATFNRLASFLFIILSFLVLFRSYIAAILADGYQEIETVIPFLLFIPVMYTLSEVTVVGVNFLKRTRYHLYISLTAFLSNALLNVVLVPTYGVRGAAIATSIAYIVFFVCRSVCGNFLYKITYDWGKFIVCLAVTFASAIVASFYTTVWFSFAIGIISILLCFSVYLSEWKEILRLALNEFNKLKA